MDLVHGRVLLVSSVSFESHGDSGGGSSLKEVGMSYESFQLFQTSKIPQNSGGLLAATRYAGL